LLQQSLSTEFISAGAHLTATKPQSLLNLNRQPAAQAQGSQLPARRASAGIQHSSKIEIVESA
jgi:hypothetical protein